MSNEIKNLIFDFNGVISKANKKEILNKLDFKDVCNLVCYSFSFLTNSGFRNAVVSSYKGLMLGNHSEEFYSLFDNEHQNNTVRKIVDNYIDSMRTRQGLLSLIDHLRDNGFKVFILSNSIPETEIMIKSDEISSHFDGVYCSSEHGLIKPERDVFEDACKLWGILPEESIFVDDKKENTKGAKKSGFKKAYHLTNENEIIEKVSECVL